MMVGRGRSVAGLAADLRLMTDDAHGARSAQLQRCAEKRDCFAKHQPGVAGCGRLWLAAGRQKLSRNLAPFLLLNPVQA